MFNKIDQRFHTPTNVNDENQQATLQDSLQVAIQPITRAGAKGIK
jgi:hypothetical protein